jgi:asparagine synthase (glutamine-hydrolysing)
MCGIAGCSRLSPMEPRFAQALGARMSSALHRRGPDGGRVHHDGDVLLVHRRLSILDLSEAGMQPLWNEDRTVCVVVNGEIYNFASLREQLVARGHRFRSSSDSEVLVHLYEDRGIDACCAALEGMFAFALWDARSRDLYLVRDRLGIKPLALAEHAEGVTFGSVLPAIVQDAAVPHEINEAALAAVMRWGFVPSPWSALRGVRRVAPGSLVQLRAGRVVAERRWWTDVPALAEVAETELRATLAQAVESHLVADVPVGSLLSAGIDSGLITALAAAHAPADFAVWTVSHRGHDEDELEDALRAARHIGVELTEIPVGGSGLTEARFDQMVAAMDEPLSDASLIGLHAMFEAIAPQRRVVLSGDGGDELFAGYSWHAGMPQLPSWARSRVFEASAPVLAQLSGARGVIGTIGGVAAHLRRHPAEVYLDKLRVAEDEELAALGIAGGAEPIAGAAREAWERFEGAGVLEQMLAVDRATMLADQMLPKADTSSMAHSIELRVPMLADSVLAAAKGLAPSLKREGERGKLALRRWYAEIGAPGLADRRKTGFNSPVASWLANAEGRFLVERAHAGLARFGTARTASPRLMLAAAVVASWVELQRARPLAAA